FPFTSEEKRIRDCSFRRCIALLSATGAKEARGTPILAITESNSHRIAGCAAAADAQAGREWIGSGIIGNCRPRRQLEPKHIGTLAFEPFGLNQQPFSVRRRPGVPWGSFAAESHCATQKP